MHRLSSYLWPAIGPPDPQGRFPYTKCREGSLLMTLRAATSRPGAEQAALLLFRGLRRPGYAAPNRRSSFLSWFSPMPLAFFATGMSSLFGRRLRSRRSRCRCSATPLSLAPLAVAVIGNRLLASGYCRCTLSPRHRVAASPCQSFPPLLLLATGYWLLATVVAPCPRVTVWPRLRVSPSRRCRRSLSPCLPLSFRWVVSAHREGNKCWLEQVLRTMGNAQDKRRISQRFRRRHWPRWWTS